MKQFHVSQDGSPSGDGSEDRPWSSLEQARDALRRLAAAGESTAGSTVWINGGDYRRLASFVLDARDGGSEGAPITYRARPRAKVRLLGGPVITAFQPVRNPAVLWRLKPAARSNVVMADLKAAGVRDFGHFSRRGFSLTAPASHLELFFNGTPMTVAQWPNAGSFLTLSGVGEPDTNEWKQPVGKPAGGFLFDPKNLGKWAASNEIWAHGYWSWDWANSYERVVRIDPATGAVQTAPPHCVYGFKTGQRFYFLNILEELDEPGEFWVDTAAGILYFWPPGPLKDAEVRVSVLEEPLIRIDGARHVVIRDLTLEAGRASGLEMTGGSQVTVGGCVIRGMGTHGAAVRGGTGHRVDGCEIAHAGDGGLILEGGDRATLTPAGHEAFNNHIHHSSRWSRTYKPGISATGCGLRIANNLIHDLPHTAILYWGNEMLIEGNEIYNICLETGDAGAIYTGRDYTFRGNVIRWNFIHHMGGVGMGTSAIYMDDCVSGHRIEGNIVWGGDAIWLGGGRDFVIRDNLFINCKGAICFDARGVDANPNWQTMVNTTMKERIELLHAWDPPYAERYPEIAAIRPYLEAGKGVPPENNRADGNWCVNCELVRPWPHVAKPEPGWLAQQGNVVDPEPGFAAAGEGDFRLGPDSKAVKAGFVPPPFERIGLVAGAYRSVENTHPGRALSWTC